MKPGNIRVLLALVLAAFGALAPEGWAGEAAARERKAYEHALVAAGLAKLGVDDSYVIVLADQPDLVERTAAEMLGQLLERGGMTPKVVSASAAPATKRFLLGRDANLPDITRLGDRGVLKIRAVSAEDDGFQLKRVGTDIVIAGANPRGVLYGVYALEDFVEAGAAGALDVEKVPYFRKRGSGPQYSFNTYVNIATEDFPEAKAAYLSRLGINELTDQGIGGSLHDFVQSDVFPFQKSPTDEKGLQPRGADFRRKVRAMSALCRKYGIDQYIFLSEPALAKVGGDISQYPPEALGAVKRPWGGGKDGMDVTLCVSSPIVQRHLRNMMGKFVREYPDVKGVIFYNMDMNDWLCTPALCPRCKAVCTDSPPDEYNPWETQANLVTLLTGAAHEANPSFQFRLWGAVHYHGDRFDKMVRAARGYDSLLACWNGSDRSIMVPDAAQPDPSFTVTKQVAKERAIPAVAAFEFNNIETVPKSLGFPFHVADAVQKFERWDIRNLTEIFGIVPEHNPINALTTKTFQWDPAQRPETFLADLARRQFGEVAGRRMFEAWKEMKRAFDVWNNLQFGPLDGSQFYLSMGTTAALIKPLLPINLGEFANVDLMTRVEPWRGEGYQKFKSKEFAEQMNRMSGHFSRAAAEARAAVQAASDREFIGLWYYRGPNGRPTRREYAELNYGSIALVDALCRQKCDVVRAYHLLTEMEAARTAGDTAARQKEYRELLNKDLGEQRQFRELLEGLAKLTPSYERTSLTSGEIQNLLALTKTKTDLLQAFLAKNASP